MRINTLSCYVPEMMLYLTNVQNQYKTVYGKEIFEKDLNGESLEYKIKQTVLAKVAQIKVLNLMAADYQITLSQSEEEKIQKAASEYIESLNIIEEELLNPQLSDVERIYEEYEIANKVYEYIVRDVNPEISDDEARNVTFQHILIKTYTLDGNKNRIEYTDKAKKEAQKTAEDVQARAELGEEDFESLATEYNEDSQMTYTVARGEMNPLVEEAAFNLDEGEVSKVIETEFGYHILKCVSTFDVEQTQENKKRILQERKDAVFKETYDNYLPKLQKNLNEPLWDSIELIMDPAVTTDDLFTEF